MIKFRNILDRIPTISEHAFRRKDYVKYNVFLQIYNIAEHVIKILTFNQPLSINHWLGEIYGFISKFNGVYLVPDNKFLPYKKLYKYLYIGPFSDENFLDGIRTIIFRAIEYGDSEDNKKIISISDEEAKIMAKKIHAFYQQLCLALSKRTISKKEFFEIAQNTLL